jgi:predicted transposase YdaD
MNNLSAYIIYEYEQYTEYREKMCKQFLSKLSSRLDVLDINQPISFPVCCKGELKKFLQDKSISYTEDREKHLNTVYFEGEKDIFKARIYKL